ncbi:hypothetical protein [Kumtagia ephedrae]|uniref:Secreted protein n=1 Tax=Kumtagia ephedrae TaxID=2116701 RepID=A0A2P7RU00_9HYPH|nr:hypothetical protein [Mesorhizobium ephedrae]PSJ53700.1 hypothetical protein C7I84_24935 [Mesorhizobium ephedrae]
MKRLLSHLRSGLAALGAAGFLASEAVAGPVMLPPVSGGERPVLLVQADCYAIGQEVAAQRGGTLARASQSNQGGRPVCVIVVLIPGKDGQRPRRTEVVVPLN